MGKNNLVYRTIYLFFFASFRVFRGQSNPRETLWNKKNAPAAEPPERFEAYFAALADFRAQEAAVIFDSHSAAAE